MIEKEDQNNFYNISETSIYSDIVDKIAANPEYSMKVNCEKYETYNGIIIDKEFLKGPFGPSYIAEDTLKILKDNFDKKKYIGLAAPQIGIPERVAVIWDKENTEWIDIVDWKILNKLQPFEIEESCLSFPGKTYITKRYRQIIIEDNNGQKTSWYYGDDDAESFWYEKNIITIAIQHEIDHLNGVLIDEIAISERDVKIAVEQRTVIKVGRNDPCPCCSGKKYKRCCGK